MTANNLRVTILYGHCEGKRIGAAFARALVEEGFAVTNDARHADVIVAHSGGCYLLPAQSAARVVMLIGVPFWPGKSLESRRRQKVRMDVAKARREKRLGRWLVKTFWNTVYFWKLPDTVRMLRGIHSNELSGLTGKQVVHVRNDDDAFCSPEISAAPFLSGAQFVNLPGQHDDCWLHHASYTKIISESWRAAANSLH